MDDLSMHLNSSGIEGSLGTAFINHLCYADDLCLISLSSSETSRMQQLLHICNEALQHLFLINPKFHWYPLVCRYLGTTISIKNSDLEKNVCKC